MRMYSQNPLEGLDGQVEPVDLAQDGAQRGNRLEMPRFQRQRAFKIGHRRPEHLGPRQGHGTPVPALGEIRRMIGQRGEMADGRLHIARLQRVRPALQKQVHRRRARFRPFHLDIPGHPARSGGVGVLQLAIQPVELLPVRRP